MVEPDFYPDINKYIEESELNSISIEYLDELVYLVRATTGLTVEQCQIIVRGYFIELMNSVLEGQKTRVTDQCFFTLRDKGKRLNFNVLRPFRRKINGKSKKRSI